MNIRLRISNSDKEILKLRKQLDNAYHIIRKLSDKQVGKLLGKIVSYDNMDVDNCVINLNNFYYSYIIANSKDINLAKSKYFEIIAEKGNHLTLKPISLPQI